jgi:hypothetical protein
LPGPSAYFLGIDGPSGPLVFSRTRGGKLVSQAACNLRRSVSRLSAGRSGRGGRDPTLKRIRDVEAQFGQT